MENKLLKYITSDAQKDKVDDVIDKLFLLKNVSHNFNDIIENEKIMLDYKTLDLFYDFLYAFKKIYTSVNLENFIDELDEITSDNEITFWKNILKSFNNIKIIEVQTVFLREMNIDKFYDLIEYTFNRHILYNNIIKEYKEWDREKIKIVEKTINTFLQCMIIDFNDLDTAIYDLDLRFQFGREKYQFIWNLCEKNKQYLMMKQIINSLNSKNN